MFENLKDGLAEKVQEMKDMAMEMMEGKNSRYNLEQFEDPIALTTQWTPAKSGGASFKTHKLIMDEFGALRYKMAIGNIIFSMIFIMVGLATTVGGVYMLVKTIFLSANSSGNIDFTFLFLILFGLMFSLPGALMLYFSSAPIVFDKKIGYFWKGRTKPNNRENNGKIKYLAKLEEVHAIQLLSEYIRGDKSSYYSYELNLVLKNGNRVNVVDHGNEVKIREDAQTISEYLEIAVWDVI